LKKSKEIVNSPLLSRLLKGTGAQAFSQLVQISIRLSEVPLFLFFWGTQLYGEWLMLSAVPLYLSFSDGGFAGAACREMTMRSGSGDKKGVVAVFQSTWLLLVFISGSAYMLTFVIVGVLPIKEILGFTVLDVNEIRSVILLLVAHVLIGFQGGLLNGGFWVSGRYPTGMYFLSLTRILEFSGLSISVIMGGGPVEAAIGYLIGRVCGTTLMLYGQRRATPWLRHGFSRVSITELRKLIVPAFASLAFPLGNALNIQGMRLAVGISLGPTAVAIFSTLRTLSRLVIQPRAIINQLFQPELSLSFGANDMSLFRHLFRKSCQFSFWGCFLFCVLVGPITHFLFPFWSGGKLTIDWLTYSVLLLAAFVNGIWYTALLVPYATNQHGSLSLYYASVYGAIALIFGYHFSSAMGIVGAAIALLLVESLMSTIVVHTSIRLAGVSFSHWLRSILQPPVGFIFSTPLNLKKYIFSLPKYT
jgi:O-antigen/teichoic acid export membrane protein